MFCDRKRSLSYHVAFSEGGPEQIGRIRPKAPRQYGCASKSLPPNIWVRLTSLCGGICSFLVVNQAALLLIHSHVFAASRSFWPPVPPLRQHGLRSEVRVVEFRGSGPFMDPGSGRSIPVLACPGPGELDGAGYDRFRWGHLGSRPTRPTRWHPNLSLIHI